MTLNDIQKKYYRRNVFSITSLIVALCASFAIMAINGKRTVVLAVFGFISLLLCLLCVINVRRIGKKFFYYDFFTQTPNHYAVLRKAGYLCYKKKLYQYNSLYLNVKEFKYYNQRYGAAGGDEILQLYAKELEKFIKNHDGYFGRLGGDNFFILIRKDEYACLLDFIKSVPVEILFENQRYRIHVKARAGITFLTNEINIRNIIFYSSIALSAGRNAMVDFSVFNSSMLELYTKEKQLVSDVQRALNENEFVPYYQPKVSAKSETLCGSEALVRWIKNGEVIGPDEFIPALEKANAIYDVDFRVFELVCRDIRDWLNRGIEPLRVSTNFSKLHLNDPEFVQKIIEIKNRYNVDGKYLEIELTESAGVNNFEVILQFAAQIRGAGMRVAIDDFGTGYSSLSMLQSIKADVVKMDKSFLDNCFNSDEKGKLFIADVISIVNHQDEEVLFEGVENKEQLDFLVQNGCNIIQGFYFDKPLVHDEYEERLKQPKY